MTLIKLYKKRVKLHAKKFSSRNRVCDELNRLPELDVNRRVGMNLREIWTIISGIVGDLNEL